MSCRYIAVLGDRNGDDSAIRRAAPVLRNSGLFPRLLTRSIGLFAAEGTPTLALFGNSILVGHVFRRDGSPLRATGDVPGSLNGPQLRRFLLEDCWGEYVLMQPDTNESADLVIMRDPSGGVPCFHSDDAEPRFVTSDISIATHHGLYRKQVDWDFINRCLVYPHQVTQRTALSNVRELLPGCLLCVRETDVACEQAWSPWDFVASGRRNDNPDEAAARVRDGVMTATRAWADTDRSVLLEMSGGLDSSILATCLHKTDANVSCCTLVTSVPGADERQYAGLVAEYLGVPLQVEELGFGLARFDAPPPSWSVAPRISILQHALNEVMTEVGGKEDVASHFSGGGGDTIFCYLGNAAPAADAFRERGVSAGTNAIRELSLLHQCTFWKAARLTLDKLVRQPKAPYGADLTFLAPQVAAMPPDRHPWFEAPGDALPGDRQRIELLAGTQLYRHAMSRGPSRELRLPLLSQPVVEACLTAPTWMWIAGGRNRSVARAAFSNDLPREILERRSKGDFAQYLGAVWRRNGQRMLDFLLEGELQARGLLAPDSLRDFLRRRLAPRDRSFFRIFELCMIENWVRHQR
ncbi:asparagine synthase-related protein [Luteimonas notoginsengisoli]|uniref:asparagine synthase (glutamine-hydrolyzing) n=1 Tax=Luteimonas notoginsengisoli TaxID=1578200 RepID=A0ABV7UUG8_9GAMM